jgi:tRNA-dihydrouridine synthase B
MRKFGIKYSRLHPQPLAVRDAFIAVRNNTDWEAVLGRWYAEDLPGRHPGPDDIDEVECGPAGNRVRQNAGVEH